MTCYDAVIKREKDARAKRRPKHANRRETAIAFGLVCFSNDKIVCLIIPVFASVFALALGIALAFVCFVQVTINRRLLIDRDVHLDQSEAYDLS